MNQKRISLSLKENINMVRSELSSEEQFFEQAIVTERFIKKYKNVIVAIAVAIAVGVVGVVAYRAYEENRVEKSNLALEKLMKDVNDAAALSELKSTNPALHDLWMLSLSAAKGDMASLEKLKGSTAPFVSDLSSYQTANTPKMLDDYAMKQESIYKDLALVQGAILLMKENKMDEAHEKLSRVSVDSALGKVAAALLHYGVK